MFERIAIFVLYGLLGAVAAIHKLKGDFVPAWFTEKFEPTILAIAPFTLPLCYALIIALELAIPVLFLIALFRKEFTQTSDQRFAQLGFKTSLSLFLILFFGSFLVQDYENGFLDFMYFAATIYLMRFTTNKSSA